MMRRTFKQIIQLGASAIAFMGLSNSASADTFVSNILGGNWNNHLIWSKPISRIGDVPGPGDDVIILGTVSPVTLNTNTTVNSVSIGDGLLDLGILRMAGGHTLTVTNDFEIHGGNVIFTNYTSDHTLNVGGDLILDEPDGYLALGEDAVINVGGNMTVTDGNVYYIPSALVDNLLDVVIALLFGGDIPSEGGEINVTCNLTVENVPADFRMSPNGILRVGGHLDIDPNSEFRPNSGEVELTGACGGNQNIVGNFTGADAFYNLVINNSNPINTVSPITNPIEITNFLDLQAGELVSTTSGTPLVIVSNPNPDGVGVGISSSATHGPATSGGFVNGGIRRRMGQNSTGSRLFPVGTTDQYTPAYMNITTGNTNGTASFVDVFPFNAEHPKVVANSGDSSLAHDRYWTINNQGTTGIIYGLTFGFDDTENTPIEANQRIAYSKPGAAFRTFLTALNGGANTASCGSITDFGDFTLLQQGLLDILKVDLNSFEAITSNNGESVELRWETASEFDSVGFHIFAGDAQGPTHQITESMIFVKGDQHSGALYSYTDESPQQSNGSYYYYLQDIDITGREGFFGPATISTNQLNKTTVENWLIFE